MARLVGYFLLLSLLTTGFMGYVALEEGQKNLTDSVFKRLSAVATLKADTFSLWMDEQRQKMVFLSSVPSVRYQLTMLFRLGKTDPLYQENFALLSEYMQHLTSNPGSELNRIFIFPRKNSALPQRDLFVRNN